MALNFVTFNQDNSILGVATSKGFRQYSLEPFSQYYKSQDGDFAMLEMLFSTSLVALVLSPRLLRIINTKRQSTICELTFPTRILALKMNRKRLIVLLEGEIFIYDISNMKMLRTLETSPNPNAVVALSPSSENNYLLYPLPQKATPSHAPPAHAPPSGTHIAPTSGDVLVYDATKLEAVNVIEAHQAPLSCISLNNEGTLLATASEKGTIIRVFSVPKGEKLFQFRRGTIPSRIYSMSFNATSTLLCVSSASETVHVFRLVNTGKASAETSEPSSPRERELRPSSRERSLSPASEEQYDSGDYGDASAVDASTICERKPINATLASMIRHTSQSVGMNIASRVGGYLPKGMTEMWEPERDFAWVKVPRSPGAGSAGPVRTVVAMSGSSPRLMAVSSEGAMFVFRLDLEKGGEGIIEGQYSITNSDDKGNGEHMSPPPRRPSGLFS